MINDTMIRHSPETGYPVDRVRRRGRVQARPDAGMPRDPWHRRALRWLLYVVAGAFFIAAIAWLGLGLAGHARAWLADSAAAAAASELEESWSEEVPGDGMDYPASALPPGAAGGFAPASAPGPGQAWGTLHVPSLGLRDVPVFEGTDSEQINVGVGHYPATELPWQAGGNLGLAGHRTGWGQPFNRLDELAAGDTAFLETREAFFEYTVTGSAGVEPTDTWVLTDEPGPLTATSGDSQLMTLTTCDGPNNEMRHVVWAQMTAVIDKAGGGVPAALA
jgi:LPXTG-site transpeptidase (sortase) family protein